MTPARSALFARLLVPVFPVLLACWGTPAPAGAQEPPPESEVAGESFTVEGVTESVAEIMERDAQLPLGALRIREKPEPGEREEKSPNPDAPDVPRWPPPEEDGIPPMLRPAGPYLPQTIGTNFLAIQVSESGFIPPDSMGAAGPTQILAIANGRIKVFDKAGVLGPLNTTTDNFFASVGGMTNGTTDPHIRYDRLSQRWYVVMIDVGNPICPNNVLLAVSSSPTITGTSSFTFFSFVGEANHFADYPTLGVDANALYIGANMFDQAGLGCTAPFDPLNTTAFVIRKSAINGGTLTATAFRGLINYGSGIGMFTPQGVDNDDPAATQGYVIGVDFFQFSRLVMRRISTPGGTPTISGDIALTVPVTVFPMDQPQPASGPNLDALDDRLFAAAIHRDKITGSSTLWTAHNFEVNAAGTGSAAGSRNGSRWYEIDNLGTTPTLRQSGTLFDPAATSPFGYWIPSVTMSGQGHMAIATSRASDSAANGGFASVAAAGRLRTDTLGTTQFATTVVAATATYNQAGGPPERWGDYSQTVVDPNDDQTMWTFQEYTNAINSWGVQVTRLVAPPPATPATTNPPTVNQGQPSINVTITGTSTLGSEFFDPGPDTGGPGFANRISATVTPGVTVNSVTFNTPTQVTLNISTVGATTGAKNVAVTNPDGQVRTGNGILTVLVSCPAITVNPPSIPAGTAGTAYSQTFTQAGGSGTITWSVTGTLPTGVTLNASTGVLSGTPTQTGSFPITVTATDANACTGSRDYTLVVNCQTITVNPTTIPAGTAGSPYSQTFTQTNGIGTITWSVTGTLPTGITFNTSTGVLSGTPTQIGSFPITVTATDANGCIGSQGYTLVITGAGTFGPIALSVDAAGNRVFEPGETVVVAPSWRNDTGASQAVTGAATNFIGPGTPTYTISDATANYGTVADGATASCSTGGDCYGLGVSVANPRPTLHWDSSFLETLSSSEAKTWTLHIGASFTDVPTTSGFYRFVETILHKNVTGGCTATTYCPGNSTTREQMAVFVLVSKAPGAAPPPACVAGSETFADVPATSLFCRWIEELARRGVVTGCGGNNYCPAASATREQMAVFVLRTLDPTLNPPACVAPNIYADVPETSGFCRWIEELTNRAVVTGCGGGNYCPTADVIRQEMSVFLAVTFGLTLYGL